MLSDLRRYIIEKNEFTESSALFKKICEHSCSHEYVINNLESMQTNFGRGFALETGIFENIAMNYHLADIVEGDNDFILRLIISCFGETATVETEYEPMIQCFKYLCEYPKNDAEYSSLYDFMEEAMYSQIDSEIVERILDIATDPSKDPYQAHIELLNLHEDDYEEYDYVIYNFFSIDKSEPLYEQFVDYMTLIGSLKITNELWFNGIAGCNDGYGGYYLEEYLDSYNDEVEEIIDRTIKRYDLSIFDDVFVQTDQCMNYGNNHIIQMLLEAKRTEREVLM